jgi:hypothetical protein
VRVLFRWGGEGGALEVMDDGGTQRWSVPMDGFSMVSAVRWCPHREELILTGVAVGGRIPNASRAVNERGELRLFRCSPRHGGAWQKLSTGYAHDPVCLPDGGYVVHRGAGLAFLDDDGAVVREVNVGRFSWGEPSLSVNQAGDRLAWIRWKGDDRKPCVVDISGAHSFQARPSVHRYAWFDPHTLVYFYGAGLRLLDVASSKTRALGFGLLHDIRTERVETASDWSEFVDGSRGEVWVSYDDVRVVGDAVWFSAGLFNPAAGLSISGVFRLDGIAGSLTVTATVDADKHLEDFEAMSDGSLLLYLAPRPGIEMGERSLIATGPRADLLRTGWLPINESIQPTFRFHGLPQL